MRDARRVIVLDYSSAPRPVADEQALPEVARLLRRGREPMPQTICLKCVAANRHGVRKGTGPHAPHYRGDQLVDCAGDPVIPGET